MIRAKKLATAFLIISLISIQCKETSLEPRKETSLAPTIGRNLLENGSFEVDHGPTLQGWQLGSSQLASLANDAPPGGGNWSLKLTADWAPTMGFAYTSVNHLRSGDIVKLSSFIRGIRGGAGFIELRVGPSIWNANGKSISSQDILWRKISLTDTLTLGPNDSVWVVLSSGHTEWLAREGLFDLVRLEKMSN